MKIDRLYTREQFDKILKERFENAEEGMKNAVGRECFELELKFGELHSKPLKKEMFVNELEEPRPEDYGILPKRILHEDYEKDLEAYQEAEKKVIIKNVSIKDVGFGSKSIRIGKIKIGYIDKQGKAFFNGANLYDLAEENNGKIELKNVEI